MAPFTIRPALALVAVVCVAAPAEAAQPNPGLTTSNAVARLLNDTAALGSRDAGATTRERLRASARQVGALALTRPCGAVVALRGYRARLRSVTDRRTKTPGGAPGPPSKRGQLARDALAVDAGLKQLPGSRRCGGGAASAKASLESTVVTSTKKTLRLRVKLPVARWEALSGGGRDFVRVNMDGTDSVGQVGDPGVPAFTRMFAVPRGAKISVAVSNARGYTLEGIDVMPKQEQAVDDEAAPDAPPASTFADKRFKIDRRAYAGRGKVPAKLAYARTFGVMRDLVVGGVQIPGAQYDRRKRSLRVFTSMDVKVTFTKGGEWLGGGLRTAQEAGFDSLYASSLENYGAVARSARARVSADPAPCGEEYLIVTSPALRPAADQLAEIKAKQGFQVGIHEVAPGTANVDVRTFIRGEMNSKVCTRPSYVLLIGDTSHVPSFLETCPGIENCQVTSDLSYSLDGISTDAFADVMLGRLPANTLDVAQAIVAKIITYETQLPAPPGDDFYNHATVTSNFEGVGPRDQRGFTLSAERMRAGLRSRGHVVTRLNTAQAAADIQEFKDGTPFPPELKRPATTWTDGRDQVVSELNAGRFLFVHRDHGSRLGWANPGININDIGLLNTNSTKLPVVIAINCSSAGFQFPGNPSFDEQLLQRTGGGAVAVIGDTDVSPTVQNDQLTVGYADAMFPQTVPGFGSAQPLKQLGQILVAGKSFMAAQAPASQQLTGQVYREHLLWHLLGDPSMQIRSADPVQFDPAKIVRKYEYRTDNPPIGDPGFKVRVTTTLQPEAEGALVTLLHAGEAIGRATVAGGVALITPTKRTDSASLSVTLEDDGFEQQTFPVSAPVPSLTAQCQVNDTSPPGSHNVQMTGTVSPAVSGATIRVKLTKASGAVVTGTTTTVAGSTFALKLPIADADTGPATVQAFYDGERKYGADDVACTVEL